MAAKKNTKMIVTGCTGWVGSAVMKYCLEETSITSIVALTRRPLDQAITDNAKVTTVIVKDFLNYDADTIEKLKGAGGCIWALGSPTSGAEVHRDYTMHAVDSLLKHVIPDSKDLPFRFVYTSGGAVPLIDSPAFFFLGNLRKVRNQLDHAVADLQTEHEGKWESFVARPWAIVDAPPMTRYVFGEGSWIYRTELAAAMTDLALVGGGEESILTNVMLRDRGRRVLDAQVKS